MRTIETVDAGTLRDDELDGVSGGVIKIDLGFFGRIYLAEGTGLTGGIGYMCWGVPEVRGGSGVSCGPTFPI